MGAFDLARLRKIGFEEIAQWRLEGEVLTYVLNNGPKSEALSEFPNVLYAFTCKEKILYIGKTTQGLKIRFRGYCKPGPTQVTNQKCHNEILKLLKNKFPVSISVFGECRLRLHHEAFEINMAAGLEDSLIESFAPVWNGRLVPREFVTETRVIEEEALLQDLTPRTALPSTLDGAPKFELRIGKTYFSQGFINLPTFVTDQIGEHGEPILIRLGELGDIRLEARINRNANQNKTPRIFGGARLAQWFQEHLAMGDLVKGFVLSRNEILLRKDGKD